MGSGEEGVKIDEQIILGKCRHAEHSNGNQVSIIFTIRANSLWVYFVSTFTEVRYKRHLAYLANN